MNIYEVQPIFSHPTHPFELTIDAPGSKSITNRALMLAALANGETLLKGALFSDDSRHFLQCLKDLGFDVVVDEPAHTVRVTGLGGRIPKETAAINVGSAGTAARFLTAMLGCAKGVWHLDASEQMKKRPMAALLNTLTDLGCRIDCHEKEGYFPFTIYSEGITASEATVDIGDSSQFLSALLMAAVMMDHDFAIHITGNHGFSYIHMTTAMMRQFGVEISDIFRFLFECLGKCIDETAVYTAVKIYLHNQWQCHVGRNHALSEIVFEPLESFIGISAVSSCQIGKTLCPF